MVKVPLARTHNVNVKQMSMYNDDPDAENYDDDDDDEGQCDDDGEECDRV